MQLREQQITTHHGHRKYTRGNILSKQNKTRYFFQII